MQHTKEEIRSRILEAALDEFEQHGYADASIRRIVAAAGSSLGNLYRYYDSKLALFKAIVDPVTEQCIAFTDSSFELSHGGLSIAAQRMVEYFAQHLREFNILQAGPPEQYGGFLARFGECIAKKIKAYALNTPGALPHKPVNPDFYEAAAACCISGMRFIMERYIDEQTTRAYIEELLLFLFDDAEHRLL